MKTERVTYHLDSDRGDYEIRLERTDSPIPHRVLCRASSLALARHKSRKRADVLGIEWGAPVADAAPVVAPEPEPAPIPLPARDYPTSARRLIALIESGELSRVELVNLRGLERIEKNRKTVQAAIDTMLDE